MFDSSLAYVFAVSHTLFLENILWDVEHQLRPSQCHTWL